MTLPGRSFNSDGYRYGYNGQEKSKENCGCGNTYTAQYWEYDSRIARRWNVDPVEDVGVSPYAVNRNNPIVYSDPNGDCPWCIGFIIGVVSELAEQIVSNGLKNLNEGKGFFDNWTKNIDVADVLISGVQGALTGGLGKLANVSKAEKVALWAMNENTGNMFKSAIDYQPLDNGFTNIFDETKSIEDAERDYLANTVGSATGGMLSAPSSAVVKAEVKSTAKTTLKATVKTVLKETPGAIAGGSRTVAYEGLTDMSINKAKENSNKKSKPKNTTTPQNNTTSKQRQLTDAQYFYREIQRNGGKVNYLKKGKGNYYDYEVENKKGDKISGGYVRGSTNVPGIVK